MNELKQRRKAAKLSQTQLSVRARVPFPIIGLFEHPERIERYQRQIADALREVEVQQEQKTPQAA